ncbi:unannotated protein [freshwater metagenome]|uniref:Unannotated protein n=1 Tax=freshwater metagenome TaxID=449393 RepID=A0A6J7HYV3_9ZZZZ|nr:hypothetical protein [Actinomycetota bacterium]
MRVRAVAPGAATACAVALAGCGGTDDGTRTVTVTTATAASAPLTAPDGAEARPVATTTTTTTTTRTRTATRPSPPARTVRVPTTVTTTAPPTTERDRPSEPAPREPGEFEDDPVGGTVVARGRVPGTGYSVRVPDGWNDGARRFEGSGVAFDLTYVKGRGSGVTSNILVVRAPDRVAQGRDAVDLREALRRRAQAVTGGADVTTGPRVRIDGETAVSFEARRRVGPTTVVQRQVAVVRDGVVYTIGLNAVRETAAEDERTFAAFLRSWRWR